MTLNFPRRPIFPVNLSEDKWVSSIKLANEFILEDFLDNNEGGNGKPQDLISDIDFSGKYHHETDRGGSGEEPISDNDRDRLPSDPFDMNVNTTVTFRTEGLNLIWNRAMKFQAEPGNIEIYGTSNPACYFDGLMKEKELADGSSCNSGFISISNIEEFVSFYNGDIRVSSRRSEKFEGGSGSFSFENGGVPHEGLLYTLGYLGVQDLLSVERVCRSLHAAVQGDNLLWRTIHIDQPLSERICDDALVRLTNKAQGNLKCLSLVKCLGITNDGLRRVLERNPRLEKLSVPGCTRLSIEAIVNNLKAFKSLGAPGIKHLRIGARHDITYKHLEELKFLLSAEKVMQQPKTHKPRFYHNEHSSFSCDDDRDIDIEMCPRCQSLRLIYDCPAESCQRKQFGSEICRGCTTCISRCFMCGQCVDDKKYEETFCLDMLCLDCCLDNLLLSTSSQQTVFHQEARYELHMCG